MRHLGRDDIWDNTRTLRKRKVKEMSEDYMTFKSSWGPIHHGDIFSLVITVYRVFTTVLLFVLLMVGLLVIKSLDQGVDLWESANWYSLVEFKGTVGPWWRRVLYFYYALFTCFSWTTAWQTIYPTPHCHGFKAIFLQTAWNARMSILHVNFFQGLWRYTLGKLHMVEVLTCIMPI